MKTVNYYNVESKTQENETTEAAVSVDACLDIIKMFDDGRLAEASDGPMKNIQAKRRQLVEASLDRLIDLFGDDEDDDELGFEELDD